MKRKKLPFYKITENLGAVLKKYRRGAKVTQQQIADLSGLSRSYISSIERGLYNINGKTLLIYMAACDININDILKEEE